MAKKTGDGSRKGAVKERVQVQNPVTQRYIKIDTSTGRIIDQKKTAGPYKGIRELKPKKSGLGMPLIFFRRFRMMS